MNIQSRACEITRHSFFLPILAGILLLLTPTVCLTAERDEIQRRPVQSTVIASVGYEAKGRILELEFQSGAIYRYIDVTEDIFRRLLAAESKGQFFGANIRNKFRSELVKPRAIK